MFSIVRLVTCQYSGKMNIMSDNKIVFTEQDLYRTLRKHDKVIMSRFDDPNISDSDYFFCGINSDIVSNGISILINKMSGNIESVGVDNSCRAIIEAFAIMRMDALGKISDLQKSIYRHQYALVDFDNFKSLLSEEDKSNPILDKVKADRKTAIELACKLLKCKSSDLKRHDCDDPAFYLKSNINSSIRFSTIVGTYLPQMFDIYNFFSMFIHPRFEINPDVENIFQTMKKEVYVKEILDYLVSYLRATKLIVMDRTTNDFNADFWNNPLTQTNVISIKMLENAFINLEKELCQIDKKQYDGFAWYYIEKMRYLTIDMSMNMALGYKEQVINKFKSFIEYTAVYVMVNTLDYEKDYKQVKLGYLYSSRLQIEEHIKALGGKEIPLVNKEELKKLYEDYYKEKYGLSSYEDYKREMRNNSFYFIDSGIRSYNKYINQMIDVLFNDEDDKKQVKFLYKYAKDTEHASGYNFNSSEGIWSTNCFLTLHMVFKLLMMLILQSGLTLAEHGYNPNIKNEVSLFKEFAKTYYDEYLKVVKEYTPKD